MTRKTIVAIYLLTGLAGVAYDDYDWHNRTCEWYRPAALIFHTILSPLWPIKVYSDVTEAPSMNTWRCGDSYDTPPISFPGIQHKPQD